MCPAEHPERYAEVSPTSDVRPGLPPSLLVTGDLPPALRPGVVTAFADDAYGSPTSQTSRTILLDHLRRDS
jgi:hypothetical protein